MSATSVTVFLAASTGEILVRHFSVEGTGSARTVVADVDWTFPLSMRAEKRGSALPSGARPGTERSFSRSGCDHGPER